MYYSLFLFKTKAQITKMNDSLLGNQSCKSNLNVKTAFSALIIINY